jgi:hypothetical protein
MLYQIQLENKNPLFLQLSQRASGQVDAIIPNTPEAELLAKKNECPNYCMVSFLLEVNEPRGREVLQKGIQPRVQSSDATQNWQV